MNSMRNIWLSYVLTLCRFSWFWLGIWIYFYLRFTNYTGIGLIETVLFVTTTVMEIPTGAIADLLGKKKTLFVSFLLEVIGSLLMAYAKDMPMLSISVFILAIGGALYSGTLEALVYDSLKENGKIEQFAKVISNINSLQWFFPAICSVIGGFLYTIDPRLPFIVNGGVYGIGLVVTLFLSEPHVDTNKFSIAEFVKQTKSGFHQLMKSSFIVSHMILLLSVSTIMVLVNEMLDSMMSSEFGFTAIQIGILWAVISTVAAVASQLTPVITKIWGYRFSFVFFGYALGVSLLISPLVGILLGGITLIFRSVFFAIFTNLSSVFIHSFTESRYRATTLSTYNMIKNIPYAITAIALGYASNLYTAKLVGFYLGLLICLLLSLQLVISFQMKMIKVNKESLDLPQ
ncbi:MFS transporter [Candidatus Roizmanbacteria bacterium]|nr:MFS transporter [Candidatus Roizmanbacteria bacterium]